MGFLIDLDENKPDGASEAGANWDDRERETRKAVKDTFGTEHYLTGEHKFDIGNTASAPAPGKLNRIRFNTETGDIEFDNGANWQALGFFTKRSKVVSYVGDGTANMNITGLGFLPTSVRVIPIAGGSSYIRTKNMTGVNSFKEQDGTVVTTAVKSLDADGFTVGALANANGITYDAICLRDL